MNNEKQYFLDCTTWFAPADEIAEALRNNEGCAGVSYTELCILVNSKPELLEAVNRYI